MALYNNNKAKSTNKTTRLINNLFKKYRKDDTENENEDENTKLDTLSIGLQLKEAVDSIFDPTTGMSEEEKKKFVQKLYRKLESGKKLSADEMQYLRKNDPVTYAKAKGEFGYDVFGKLLVPKPGRPGPKLRGKGFTVSEDGKSYYAQLSGKVEYRNYDLNVSNVYNVSGDVDVGTGSIDFNGDVEINGSVRGSVKIHAIGTGSRNDAVQEEKPVLRRNYDARQ